MEDRFKFRFLVTYFDDDTNENKTVMQYSYDLDYEVLGSYLFYNDEDVVIQQCTGLKDKNGKLIYEGDIITTSEYNICKENDKYKVFWHSEYCQFLFESINDGYCIDFMDMYKPEIIGNIYENPELLHK